MRSIADAVGAAEDRKTAVFGDGDDDTPRVSVADEFGEAAIYGGFDLDMDEMRDISLRAASLYTTMAATQGLIPMFQGCFCDGVLTGLMLGLQESG